MLKPLEWTKRKGTTGKVDPLGQFLMEHDIPEDLVLNLDQTPLSNVSPGKYTFYQKGSPNMPIKGLLDKRQITGTFAV